MFFLKAILRRLPNRRSMRSHFLHGVFGRVILSDDLWHISRRSLAGGLALGLFVAFTPTMPFHMVLACLGAIYFRVHLPIALAACWVNNPVTVVPIYMKAWQTGRHVLNWMPWVADTLDPHVHNVSMNGLLVNSMYLWTGSLIFATAAGGLSWLLVHCVWRDRPRETRLLTAGETETKPAAQPDVEPQT
jgi:uncharacterized protein (DUF2062 family)